MVSIFLSGLYLFIFIYSWFLLIAVGFKIAKAMILKTGKADLSKWTTPAVGFAISYIIMALIIGL